MRVWFNFGDSLTGKQDPQQADSIMKIQKELDEV